MHCIFSVDPGRPQHVWEPWKFGRTPPNRHMGRVHPDLIPLGRQKHGEQKHPRSWGSALFCKVIPRRPEVGGTAAPAVPPEQPCGRSASVAPNHSRLSHLGFGPQHHQSWQRRPDSRAWLEQPLQERILGRGEGQPSQLSSGHIMTQINTKQLKVK